MVVSARSLGLLILSLVSLSSASAPLISNGLTVILEGIYYFISPFSSGKVDVPRSFCSGPKVYSFKPVTVVNQDGVSTSQLPDLLSNWTSIDDVFSPSFASAVFLASAGNCNPKNPRDVCEIKANNGSSIVSIKNTNIASGPYFLDIVTGELYPVYRLYEDFAGAFMESVMLTPDGRFQTLSARIPSSAALAVGVPSRLYFTKTASKPLNGVRLGVKDIYRIAGMKGSNGNRAWYNLYPAATYTGPAIQNLIDAGAQVVGLQKTSQFANGELATQDWVDYHSPFNPRGDGYQDASSSSSGAGASMGSYDWLDMAIGSDTGGSIRSPAGVQGLFGNRPSHGLVSLDNVMPLSPTLDTPGFLIRDPYIWDAANQALYGENYTSLVGTKPKYPTKISPIDFPTGTTTAAATILDDFVAALASFVGGTVTPLNLTNAWDASPPAAAGGSPLFQFLNTTYVTLITKEQIPLVREPFYADYAAAHDGRRPFVNPVPLARWAHGDTLPDQALEDAVRNKTVFMDWFNGEILPRSDDPARCSEGFVLYVANQGDQYPRNQYGSGPGVPFGFSSWRISTFAEVPDSVFPLGEVSAESAITNHAESFPVAVDIMVAKGCDGLLVKLAQDLVEAGVIKVPKVGGTLEGGEVLMRRAEMRGY